MGLGFSGGGFDLDPFNGAEVLELVGGEGREAQHLVGVFRLAQVSDDAAENLDSFGFRFH